MTAKTNGLEDLAEDILAAAGLQEGDLVDLIPALAPSTLQPPTVITPSFSDNWPSVGVTESFFDRALAAAASGEASTEAQNSIDAGDGLDEWAAEPVEDATAAVEDVEDAWDLAPDADEEGMEIEEEDEIEEFEDDDMSKPLSAGVHESDLWTRNSPLAADHVAAGSFESAMGLLNRQVGVVDFAPLKPLFLSLFRSSRLYLPGAPSLPPLEIMLRRNTDHNEPRSVLPAASLTLAAITAGQLRAAYAAFQKAKFAEAATIFRSILHSLLLVVTSTPSQAAEVMLLNYELSLGDWSLTFFLLVLTSVARIDRRVSRIHYWNLARNGEEKNTRRSGDSEATTRARRLLHTLSTPTRPSFPRPPSRHDQLFESEELPHGRDVCTKASRPLPSASRRCSSQNHSEQCEQESPRYNPYGPSYRIRHLSCFSHSDRHWRCVGRRSLHGREVSRSILRYGLCC